MITLIAAAALAAQNPAATANHPMMQMAKAHEHQGMDCCRYCCKDMAAKHDGHRSAHSGHRA
jgi:hypothetical protein